LFLSSHFSEDIQFLQHQLLWTALRLLILHLSTNICKNSSFYECQRMPPNANECHTFSYTTLQLLKLFQQLQNVTHHFTRILQYLQYLHYLQFRIFPSTPLRTQHSRDFTHSSGSVTTSSRVLWTLNSVFQELPLVPSQGWTLYSFCRLDSTCSVNILKILYRSTFFYFGTKWFNSSVPLNSLSGDQCLVISMNRIVHFDITLFGLFQFIFRLEL
jgi:hypothetical protein